MCHTSPTFKMLSGIVLSVTKVIEIRYQPNVKVKRWQNTERSRYEEQSDSNRHSQTLGQAISSSCKLLAIKLTAAWNFSNKSSASTITQQGEKYAGYQQPDNARGHNMNANSNATSDCTGCRMTTTGGMSPATTFQHMYPSKWNDHDLVSAFCKNNYSYK